MSGLLLGDRLLVRRTDFGPGRDPVEIPVGPRRVPVEPRPNEVQILSLP